MAYRLLFTALVTVVCPKVGWSQQPPPVAVQVTEQGQSDGTAIYQYSVINNAANAVVGIVIGSDYYHGISELNVYPLGWSMKTGIPQGSITSPNHWTPTVVTTEESNVVEIEWKNDGTSNIQPGHIGIGFDVVAPPHSDTYLSSHWTAFMEDGTVLSGLITTAVAPHITIKLINQRMQSLGQWQALLQVSNIGSGTALGVVLNKIALRTVIGTGTATFVTSPVPLRIGNLNAGDQATIPILINIPASIKRLSITETGALQTAVENPTHSFSSAQVIYPKLQ